MRDDRFEANRDKIKERNMKGAVAPDIPHLFDPEEEEEIGKHLLTAEEIESRRRLFYTRTMRDIPASGRGRIRDDFAQSIGETAEREGRRVRAFCHQCGAEFGTCACFRK